MRLRMRYPGAIKQHPDRIKYHAQEISNQSYTPVSFGVPPLSSNIKVKVFQYDRLPRKLSKNLHITSCEIWRYDDGHSQSTHCNRALRHQLRKRWSSSRNSLLADAISIEIPLATSQLHILTVQRFLVVKSAHVRNDSGLALRHSIPWGADFFIWADKLLEIRGYPMNRVPTERVDSPSVSDAVQSFQASVSSWTFLVRIGSTIKNEVCRCKQIFLPKSYKNSRTQQRHSILKLKHTNTSGGATLLIDPTVLLHGSF